MLVNGLQQIFSYVRVQNGVFFHFILAVGRVSSYSDLERSPYCLVRSKLETLVYCCHTAIILASVPNACYGRGVHHTQNYLKLLLV